MMKRTISNFPLSMCQVVIMFLMACLSIEADGQWFKRRSHQNVFVINDEDAPVGFIRGGIHVALRWGLKGNSRVNVAP